jgi:hypothetical protein
VTPVDAFCSVFGTLSMLALILATARVGARLSAAAYRRR